MAVGREALRARLLATFRGEAEELLTEMTDKLRALQQPGHMNADTLEGLFRAMHTLKGAARSVSLREIESLCEDSESVLSRLTHGQLALQPSVIEQLRETVAGVTQLLAAPPSAAAAPARLDPSALASPAPASPVSPRQPAPDPPLPVAAVSPVSESIRIELSQFDSLIFQTEDLLLPKFAAEERVREAKQLPPLLLRCRKLLAAAQAQAATPAGIVRLLEEASEAIHQGERLSSRMLANLERQQRGLQESVDGLVGEMRRIRMTPAATVLDLLPDMIHDLAQSAGKEIRCLISGGELLIDRVVLQGIKDPLIQLVRNAVDHGIEPSDIRRSRGKPLPGSITIAVEAREGARVGITLKDDGEGVDLEMVKASAVRRRVVAADAIEQMTDREVLRLIFRSSVSTRPVVTKISGHGLGLAIVAERVERLNGSISVENDPRHGTCFCIDLPTNIASFHGLLVRCSGQLFLLPLSAVESVGRLLPAKLASVASRRFVDLNGRQTPYADLADVLDLEAAETKAEDGALIVIAVGEERAALRVDAVVGDQEVLLKTFQPPLLRVRNVASVGLLETGELALVLRPIDLMNSLKRIALPRLARPVVARQPRRRTILVVDDSITTRAMEKNLLEAIGYQVHVASDGIDAWNLLADHEINLVISDVDMPRMNGFDLTARIRADQRLSELPVILVSALESREDKAQGIRAGANAYVIKSNLENTNFQEMIERLL